MQPPTKCDQCGSPMRRNQLVPVQIGQLHPQAAMMWFQTGEQPRSNKDYTILEYCKECATHLAIALLQARKAIRNGAVQVRQ